MTANAQSLIDKFIATARAHVTEQVEEILQVALSHFFERADKAPNSQAQSEYFAGIDRLKKGRTDFVAAVGAAVSKAWDADSGEPPPSRGLSSELSIVADNVLEEELAIRGLVRQAGLRHNEAIAFLRLRLAVLNDGYLHDEDDMPMSPARIGTMIADAVTGLKMTSLQANALFKLFEQELVERMSRLYAELNGQLADAGILPYLHEVPLKRRPAFGGSPKPAARPNSADDSTANDHAPAEPALAFGQPDQQPASPARGGMPQAPRNGPSPQTQPASAMPRADGQVGLAATTPSGTHVGPRVSGRAPQSQDNAWGPPPDATVGEALESQLSEHLQEIYQLLEHSRSARNRSSQARPAGHHSGGDRVEASTDLVQEALDTINDLRRERGGRSQQSFSALRRSLQQQLDDFVPGDRRATLEAQDADSVDLVEMLFDRLRDDRMTSPLGQQLYEPLQLPILRTALEDEAFFTDPGHSARRLLEQVAEIDTQWLRDEDDPRLRAQLHSSIERVSERAHEGLDAFSAEVDKLDAALAALDKRSKIAEKRTISAAKARERVEIANAEATTLVNEMESQYEPSPLILGFIQETWVDVLTMAHLRQDQSPDEWTEAVSAMEQLCRASDKELSGRERQVLRYMDPELERRLRSGLERVGHESAAAQELLEDLKQERERAMALPEEPIAAPGSNEEESQSTSAKQTATAVPAIRRKYRQSELERPKLDQAASKELERLKQQTFGTLYEFVNNQQGDFSVRKLAWFSTVSSRCTFVDRRGHNRHECSLEQLALDISRGNVRVHVPEQKSMVTRALISIRETMNKLTGGGGDRRVARA